MAKCLILLEKQFCVSPQQVGVPQFNRNGTETVSNEINDLAVSEICAKMRDTPATAERISRVRNGVQERQQ